MKKKFFKKTAALAFALLFATCMAPAAVHADDNTFTIEGLAGTTQHDVRINGTHQSLYCMQQNYLWPTYKNGGYANAPTQYRFPRQEELLLTDSQKHIVRKVLFAGYPYNGKGYLDPVYDYFGDSGKPQADILTADMTQAILWSLMSEWNIPGNPAYTGKVNFDADEDFLNDALNNIMNYAYGSAPADPPASTEIEINGSGEIKETDGILKTEELSITDPEHCSLTYELNTPEGITAVDDQNNEVSVVKEKETFYLTAEHHDSIAEDDELTIEATLAFPGEKIHQYNTDMAPKHIISGKDKYQTMLGADIQTVGFNGALALNIKKADIPGEDPGDPNGPDPDPADPGRDDPKNDIPGNSDPDKETPDRNDQTDLNSEGSKENNAAPDTGDRIPVLPLAGMLLAAAAGIVLTVCYRR